MSTEYDIRRASPYLRKTASASLGPLSIDRLFERFRVLKTLCTFVLLSYAAVVSIFRRKPNRKTDSLALLRHFFSVEAYPVCPFVMFVNAYLHTLCAHFVSADLIGRPCIELGAGDGSFSETVFAGHKLDLMSSVLPSDTAYLRTRSIAEQLAIIDAEYIPLESDRVKSVFMIDTLYHIGDQGQAIKEIARVLMPGGVVQFNYVREEFFVRCFPIQRLLSFLKLKSLQLQDLAALKRRQLVDRIYTSSELKKLFDEAGLEVITERPFASIKAMRKALFCYWAAIHANDSLLRSLAGLKSVQRIVERLLDDVFYPLVMNDTEDCKLSGPSYTWFLLKKKGQNAR